MDGPESLVPLGDWARTGPETFLRNVNSSKLTSWTKTRRVVFSCFFVVIAPRGSGG